MSEARFEQWLREAGDSYHTPGEIPREAMWEAIVAARGHRVAGRIAPRPVPRAWYAAAATLLISTGIGLGYWLRGSASTEPGESAVAIAPVDADQQRLTYEIATTRHLTAAEALLTTFRSHVPTEGDAAVHSWARDLLSMTRLLLDSPASDDAIRKRLLEDLEYILAQIVQLSPDAPAGDRELVDGAIAKQDMMTRIRSTIPAGFPSGT